MLSLQRLQRLPTGVQVAAVPRTRPALPLRREGTSRLIAAVSSAGNGEFASEGGEDYAAVARRLDALLERPRMTGRDIRDLVFQKWGRTYDVILRKFNNRIYLQVMWRFLEQQSFPMTEEEYMQQLDAVAEYITEWGAVDVVKRGIMGANSRGPGYTGGGNAKCISIPLDVDLSKGRRAEWA